MPAGLDTVFMQEDSRRIENGRVAVPPGLAPGDNRRLRGEDIRAGEAALSAGRRLRPEDLGLTAALGVAQLVARRKLKAAIFSTGDEIVPPRRSFASFPAVYDANRFLLHGLLRRQARRGHRSWRILKDDAATIAEAAAARSANPHDLVLTSGGVSTGEEDHVKAAVLDSGSLVFWRLAIKPGRAVAMGVIDGAAFVGLPGNPVAAFVTFVLVARRLIAALSGGEYEPPRALQVRSGFAYAKKAGRREYVRVALVQGPTGTVVQKYAVDGAAVLTSLTRTHGLVELPEDIVAVAPGDAVNFRIE